MRSRRTAIAAVAIVPLVLLALHGLAIAPLAWSEVELTRLQPAAGRQFAEPLGTTWMSRHQVGESPALVLEDGIVLPCPNQPPEAIAEHGAGGYMLADGNVYLSAADNTDPRTNGRRYTLQWPTPPPVSPVLWIALAALCALAGAITIAWEWRREIRGWLANPSLGWCLAIFVIPFALHRAWPLLQVMLPGVHPDTGTYYTLVQDLFAGRWPHFEQRPPGYPLLMAAVLSVTGSLGAMVWVQTLAIGAAAMVVVVGAFRLRRSAAPWVALAMAAAATGFWPLRHDTSILSESPYTTAIWLAFGFMAWALGTRSRLAFAASSASLALVIYMRPAGVFLVVPFALTVFYLWHSGRSRGEALAFAIPFPALLFVLSFYNWNVAGVFNVTGWGEANLAAATFIYWEPDPSYPPEINDRITTIRAAVGATEQDMHLLHTSWSPAVVAPIYVKSFNVVALQHAMGTGGSYVAARPWLRRISLDSINKHRDLYGKFVAVMAYLYYVDNLRWRADYVNELNGRTLMLLTGDGRAELARDPLNGALVERYFVPSPRLRVKTADACAHSGPGAIEPTTLRRVYRAVQRVRDLLFARAIFFVTFLVGFVAATWRLVHSRGRDDLAFVAVMLSLTVVGSGVVVCLVEYAGHRYSYPTEFATYVVTAFLPWLVRARA